MRAGIPETTAIEMSGHKTRAVKHYTIVDGAMLREAGAKLVPAALLQGSKVTSSLGKITALERE